MNHQLITKQAPNELIKLNCQLASLTRAHRFSDALSLFHVIHSSHHHLRPDHYTLSTALTAAAHRRDPSAGAQLHAHSFKAGLVPFCHVANTLLYLYSKLRDLAKVKWVFDELQNPDVYSWTTFLSACTKLGDIEYAYEVFDEMPQRDVTVWNAVITGCSENGNSGIAFDLFRKMHRMSVGHDHYTYASVLSLCLVDTLSFGRQVHSLVIRTGFSGRASVTNAQLTMYFSCGKVSDAYRVFQEAEGSMYDEITYNAMIAGLVSVGRDEEAFVMFKRMMEVSLRPTELTFVSVMSYCSCIRLGFQLHAQVVKMGFEMYTSVGNATITMYSSCRDIHAAFSIFEQMREKDLVTWNTMISSYAQLDLGEEAMMAYVRMHISGIEPDEFTIGSLLTSAESVEYVEMIQALVTKNGLVLKVEVSNALITSFSRHGEILHAYEIFEEISFKNLISWNTIMSGLQLNGFPVKGLEQFSTMLRSGLLPNCFTLNIVLSICTDISSLKHGKEVQGYILRQGFSSETLLGNSLITVYAKTGSLYWSLRVFNTMIFKDTVSWNSLISAYAQHGQGKNAVICFEKMLDTGESLPDQATFTSVLSACSHSGLVEEGILIFNFMVKNYGFQPKGDHFSCIVDLLSRAGYLDEAETLVSSKSIGVETNPWWALFSSCANYGNIRLGRIVAEVILNSEGNDPGVYVQLSNIYAAAGQWEEAANVREMMDRHGVSKEPGTSWIRS